MTDETTPTDETTVDTTAPVPALEPAPEPTPAADATATEPAPTDPTPEPSPEAAPESPLHDLVDEFHGLLTRLEGLEHDIKAELATDLEAIVAKLKAAI